MAILENKVCFCQIMLLWLVKALDVQMNLLRMILQTFYILNVNFFWSKSATNNVRSLFPDVEEPAAYLFELLDLGLLKHGEDIGASLLSSPLSLIWGLFTRLGKNNRKHHPPLNFLWLYHRTNIQINKQVKKKLHHKALFIYFLFCCQLELRKEEAVLPCLSDGTWTPSRGVMLGWVLCWAGLISHAPIIACGGHHSPLHGRSGVALIRGEADWIPLKWKRERLDGDDGERVTSGVRHSDKRSSLCVFDRSNFKV